MKKKTIIIGGYLITQLSQTAYEFANEKETLDFWFGATGSEDVDVFVFDSSRPTKGKDDPFLTIFSALTLKEAVTDSIKSTKAYIVNFATN